MQTVSVVDVGVMALCDVSIGDGVSVVWEYALRTIWFSNEIQLGTMIEARVNPVAVIRSVSPLRSISRSDMVSPTGKESHQSCAENNRPRQDTGIVPSGPRNKSEACHLAVSLVSLIFLPFKAGGRPRWC